MHPHHHLRPFPRRQGDLTVDPGRPTPGVALGDLPHAEQRVRPGPQHHLLQRPDRGPVLLPRRREDPAPQPGYVLLVGAPDHAIPVENILRSVHRDGVQLVPRFASRSASVFTSSPAHVSSLSGPTVRPASGRFPATAAWSGSLLSRVPLPFGHRHLLLGHPVPPRDSAPLTIGLPGLLGPDPDGVSTFRACETRPGWAPPTPRGQRCSRDRRWVSGRRLPPLPAARPYHPVFVPSLRAHDYEASLGVYLRSPVRPSPRPVVPPDGTGALGLLPRASHPRQAGPAGARRGGDRSRTLIRNYASGMTGLQSARSLNMRDLASHPTGRGRAGRSRRRGSRDRGWW